MSRDEPQYRARSASVKYLFYVERESGNYLRNSDGGLSPWLRPQVVINPEVPTPSNRRLLLLRYKVERAGKISCTGSAQRFLC